MTQTKVDVNEVELEFKLPRGVTMGVRSLLAEFPRQRSVWDV